MLEIIIIVVHKDVLLIKKFNFTKVCDHNEKSTNQNLSNFMSVPYLNLPLEKILVIYDMEDIEKLESFVKAYGKFVLWYN